MSKFVLLYHKTGLVYATMFLIVVFGFMVLWLENFSDVYLGDLISRAMYLGGLLFIVTFSASSLRYFYKSDLTVWALKN